MTKRTTWNDGELRKLYRIYRYVCCVVIVHVRWSRASKKAQWLQQRWLRVTGEKVMGIQSRHWKKKKD